MLLGVHRTAENVYKGSAYLFSVLDGGGTFEGLHFPVVLVVDLAQLNRLLAVRVTLEVVVKSAM